MVSDSERSERTIRILTARLEELGSVLQRSGASPDAVGRLLEAASVATMHAVRLELLSADRAREVWAIQELAELQPARAGVRLAA
jgi:hypothetical protein